MFSRATKQLIASQQRRGAIVSSSTFKKASIYTSRLSDIATSKDSDQASLKGKWTAQLTKIVSTIGPTSEQLPVMQDLVTNGLRIMRLNFSHATVEEVELRVKNLKLCQGRHGASLGFEKDKNVRAILLDTRGPEIRMGKLANDFSGHEVVNMEMGNVVTLHTTKEWEDQGSTEVRDVM